MLEYPFVVAGDAHPRDVARKLRAFAKEAGESAVHYLGNIPIVAYPNSDVAAMVAKFEEQKSIIAQRKNRSEQEGRNRYVVGPSYLDSIDRRTSARRKFIRDDGSDRRAKVTPLHP
jgi:hypothetical protein